MFFPSLKEMFGKQVRVTVAKSWVSGEDKLKHLEIRCKRGVISPYSETTVAVETTHRAGKAIVALLKDKVKVFRVNDEGMDIEVPLNLVPVVFRYLKPKKRRQVSEAQRQVLAERLSRARQAGKSSLPVTNSSQPE